MTEQRGEPDDGPTLTTLRTFRDEYLLATPAGRALVREYYAVAPVIVARVPVGHTDWRWIAQRIDACVDAIAAGRPADAASLYIHMVELLRGVWLDPAPRRA